MSAVISVSAGCLSVGEGKQRGPITQIENSLYVYFILRGVWLGARCGHRPSVLPHSWAVLPPRQRQLTGLRGDPSRQGQRSLEAAGDAAAAALGPSRRGMREVGVGASEGPRPNTQQQLPKWTHRTRNHGLMSKRWLMNHSAHWEATCVRVSFILRSDAVWWFKARGERL